MTEIDFYPQATDKIDVVRRLCGKALAAGRKVWIHVPDPELARQLDERLWTTPATGFLPHCSPDHPLAAETPVIIAQDSARFHHDEVLINLGIDVPVFFGRFQRLLEIVGCEADDIAAGRNRFRHYRDRGYELRTHSREKP